MATATKRRNRKAKAKRDSRIGPTPEQEARNDFVSAGPAYRKVPVIDTMLKTEKITEAEHIKLSYYRDQASIADSSPVRSNCDFSVKGSGHGPSAAILSAKLETQRIERDMGKLSNIVRMVALDDITLSQIIIQQGHVVTARRLDMLRLEFRFGVGRIVIL